MRTRTPVFETLGEKRAVQFGASKMASAISFPTLRTSMSNAVTTSISDGP